MRQAPTEHSSFNTLRPIVCSNRPYGTLVYIHVKYLKTLVQMNMQLTEDSHEDEVIRRNPKALISNRPPSIFTREDDIVL